MDRALFHGSLPRPFKCLCDRSFGCGFPRIGGAGVGFEVATETQHLPPAGLPGSPAGKRETRAVEVDPPTPVLAAAPEVVVVAAPVAVPSPVPVQVQAPAGEPGDQVKLVLGVVPAVMKFDQELLTVRVRQQVMLLFRNEKCPLQHNFILAKPGTLAAIGALADRMLTDPQALARHYVPASPDILAQSSKLLGIGQSDLIEFTAPSEPGDYPFLCAFPGHWRMMHGVLRVVP